MVRVCWGGGEGGCGGRLLMERAGLADTCSRAERVVTGGRHPYPHS